MARENRKKRSRSGFEGGICIRSGFEGGIYIPNAANATTAMWKLTLPEVKPASPGPLSRFQHWCWGHHLYPLGNLASDVRYWLWRLCR